MQSTVSIRIAGTALLAFLGMSQVRAQDEQERQGKHFPRYKVIDLGTLGGTWSSGFGMNNAGEVAGAAATATQTGGPSATAFLWRHGHMINLGTLGGANSGASVVNIRSEVALSSGTATLDLNGEDFCYDSTHHQCLAAIWMNGKLRALPTLRGYDQTGQPVGNSQAYDINDLGQVAGFSETDTFDLTCATPGKPFQRYQFAAVIWEPNGNPRPQRPYGNDTVAFAWGINNKGEAVGVSGLCSNTDFPPGYTAPMGVRSVLWDSEGTPHDLGGLGGGFSIATAINNRGDVVGGAQSPIDGTGHIFLWTKETGKLHELGTFPGSAFTVAPCCHTINDRRQIVGFWGDTSGNSHAFLWQGGVVKNLNDLIPEHSGWDLQAAESINDAGEITGSGLINGDTHAFLAIPSHRRDGRECCGQSR